MPEGLDAEPARRWVVEDYGVTANTAVEPNATLRPRTVSVRPSSVGHLIGGRSPSKRPIHTVFGGS